MDTLLNDITLLNDKIKNYFINHEIIIKDDDDNYTIFKKILLKYKRVIGLILLVILLVLGYYCNPYNINDHINNQNETENIKYKQTGGAGALAGLAAQAGPSIADAAAQAGPSKFDQIAAKSQAGYNTKKEKVMASLKESKEKAIQGLKNSPTAMFDAGAAVAHKFKDNAGVIYQVLYSIAIFIVICVVAIPSLALLVIGIICYFLLRDKMKVIKGL